MLSFALTALFATCGIAALTSLADSAVKLRHAWASIKRELAREQTAPTPLNDSAVVVLHHAPGAAGRPARATALAVAA